VASPKDFIRRIAALEESGKFRAGVFAWHGGLAWWLLAAGRVYQAASGGAPLAEAAAATIFAGVLWAVGFHGGGRPAEGLGRRILESVLFLLVARLALSPLLAGLLAWRSALWFAVVLTALAAVSELVLRRLAGGDGTFAASGEAGRWVALFGLTRWIYAGLYTDRPSGIGDAYWYKLMLVDFVDQVRAIGLPVWTGQTEYAFNGAVVPLRLAPWYQHAGALVDWLTCRSLHFVALSNLELALNSLATVFSAYWCFRALVPRRPGTAALIAFIYAASPAVVAPLCVNDQYMTFLTAPFLPVAACALWQMARRDQARDYFALGASLAALWLAHPPIALCMSCVALVAGTIRLLRWRSVGWRRVALAAVVFAGFGSLPFASVAALGPSNATPPATDALVEFNATNYPGVFLPLLPRLARDAAGHPALPYQPGYAACLLGLFGLVVFIRRPTWAGAASLVLVVLVLALLLPIPWLNAFLWHLAPDSFIQVLNVWIVQRLAGIWTVLMVTWGAGSIALIDSDRPGPRTWVPTILLIAAVWSGLQVTPVHQWLLDTVTREANWRYLYEKHNFLLGRYSFNPFALTPSYYSHGYMDPVLEHRLLRRDLTQLASNAESAVRRGVEPAPDPDGTARIAHGAWRAVNDNNTDFYNLARQLPLPAGQHLALVIDPLRRGEKGWLQILGQDVFREYILPDSGAGMTNRPRAGGFGTLPTSSNVISLYTRHPHETLFVRNIAPEHTPVHQDFDFGRFELWRYNPDELPVRILSWVPYHLTTRAAEPGFLETPRAWLPYYRARVNGHYLPAQRSPDGQVMFPIPAGESDITLKYVPPIWLELSYWVTVMAWCGLAAWALARLLGLDAFGGRAWIPWQTPSDAPAPAPSPEA
jgi:hypothetical protein